MLSREDQLRIGCLVAFGMIVMYGFLGVVLFAILQAPK